MVIFLSKEALLLYRILTELAKLVEPPSTNGKKEFRIGLNLVQTAQQFAFTPEKVRAIIGEMFANKLIKFVDDACGKVGNKLEMVPIEALYRFCTYEIIPKVVKEVKYMKTKYPTGLEDEILGVMAKMPTDADGQILPVGNTYNFFREKLGKPELTHYAINKALSILMTRGDILSNGVAAAGVRYHVTTKVIPNVPETILVPKTDEELIEQLEAKLKVIETQRANIIRTISSLKEYPKVHDIAVKLITD